MAEDCNSFILFLNVFCKPDGKPYTDSALNSCLKRICEKAGIKSRVHNHKLRNNFNTRSVEVGVDYDVLKVNAGHSNIHQTIDTYSDPQKEFKQKELQKYNSLKVLQKLLISFYKTAKIKNLLKNVNI